MKKLISAIILTATILTVPKLAITQDTDYPCHIDHYTYEYFTVTLIEDYRYHGDNLTNHIIFTNDNIISSETLNVGDEVVAVYDGEALVTVEKVGR